MWARLFPMALPRTTATRAGQDAVCIHLDAICRSPEFARSSRLTQLLRFLVEAQRAGLEITERLIAEKVFDKDGSWDPKLDPVVRITVSRLRDKLRRFHELQDPQGARIDLPAGTYSPVVTAPSPPATNMEVASVPRRLAPLAGITVLLILSGFIFLRSRPSPVMADHFRVTPFAAQLGAEVGPAISPDGQSIAYAWEVEPGHFDLFLRKIDATKTERLTQGPGNCLNPSWSPDGRRVAFLRWGSRGEVVTLDLATREMTVVATIPVQSGAWTAEATGLLGNPGPSWTPDGKALLVSAPSPDGLRHEVWSISLATGTASPLVSEPNPLRCFFPRLSAKGELAYVRYSTHGVGEVFVMGRGQLTSDRRTIRGLTWTPDGRALIFGSNRDGSDQLWRLDAASGALSLVSTNSSSASEPSLSPDGSVIAFSEHRENWNIWRARVDPAGALKDPERFIASSGRNYDPRVSPDGATVGFLSDRSGSWQIWLADSNGQNPRQLTHQSSPWLGAFTWSPDGGRMICESRVRGHASLNWVDLKTGEMRPLERNNYEERLPSFSRDGKAVYFSSTREGEPNVYRRDLSCGAVTKVTTGTGHLAVETPDRRALVYTSSDNFLRRIPAGALGRPGDLLHPDLRPNVLWTFAGQRLYFAASDWELGRFDRDRLIPCLRLNHPLVPYVASLDASPDGSYLLFAMRDHDETDIRLRISR